MDVKLSSLGYYGVHSGYMESIYGHHCINGRLSFFQLDWRRVVVVFHFLSIAFRTEFPEQVEAIIGSEERSMS